MIFAALVGSATAAPAQTTGTTSGSPGRPVATLESATDQPLPRIRRSLIPLSLSNRFSDDPHLFSTEYLWRALHGKLRRSDETDVPTSEQYASRYGIEPELAAKILNISLAEGVDPELAFRLIRVESEFEPKARSRSGALGLAQLMPATARGIDSSLRTESAVLEPTNNLRVGFRYLRTLIEMFDGDVRLGVLAYNRGENAVIRALRRGDDPENGYARKVLGSSTTGRYKGPGVVDP